MDGLVRNGLPHVGSITSRLDWLGHMATSWNGLKVCGNMSRAEIDRKPTTVTGKFWIDLAGGIGTLLLDTSFLVG
jgi:hypothetical protein